MLCITACATPPQVPVEERSVLTEREQIDKHGGQLIRFAQPGDTMHSIAFLAGLDVNKVAAWNGINDTSKLQVGQRIRLTKPIGFVAPVAPVASVSSKAKGDSSASVAKQEKTPPKLGSQEGTSKPPVASRSQVNQPAKTVPSKPQINTVPAKSQWAWPSPGKVIRKFALARGQQGIDIQSTKGRAVSASSAGEVVYVGDSLKGYGKLIIVKHSDAFLSAYAHNDKILVNEGQRVSQGQPVGAVGINNRREAALHFQIRKNGKPVDPLNYLSNKP